MGLEDAREDNLDMASREEAVAVVPPGEVEVKKMENYDDFLVHGARKNSGFATDVAAGDIDVAQSQFAVAGSVDSTVEAPVSAGTASSADVDTVPASSSNVVESTEKVESKDLSEAVEESTGNNEDSKPNFSEDRTSECNTTQASSDLIYDAPTSAASVQDSTAGAAMSVPSADVEEKAVEVSSEKDAEVVSDELSAEVAGREEVSSKSLDEGSAEKRDSEASAIPMEEVNLVAQDTTPVNRNEAIATPQAASPRSADVQERCAELDFKDAGALKDDVSPQIEDSGSAKKDDSDALPDRVEEYQEITDAATSANPDEDASSLEASISPSVGIREESVEQDSKDAGAASEGVSPSIVDEELTKKGDSESPSTPLEVVEEVKDASTKVDPDEHLASLNAVPSPSVDAGVKSIDLDSDDARALNEHVSPLIDEGGSAEIGENEAPEAAVVEVHGLAEATTSAAPDDDLAGIEAAHSPSTDVGDTSVKLDSEDVGTVSDDVSSVVQDEESADKGDNDAPIASISAEPDEAVGNLDAEPPPSVSVGVNSAELDSEGTRALNADVGPRIEEEVSAQKGDADAAEVPREEVHDVVAATSSAEADPDAASLEAAPSPSVDIGDKSVELKSEGAGAESEDANLKGAAEGSAKAGDSTGTEAPAKEDKESTEVAPSVEPEEDTADLDAPPSHSDGFDSVEADAEDAGTLNESGSPKIEDEGSAAEKGESKKIAPPKVVNEVAEPKSNAEPLKAAPSPIANVEEKPFELDPEVARALSVDASPEIKDEGSAAEKGESEFSAPPEEVNEDAEPTSIAVPLDAASSPSVDVGDNIVEQNSENVEAVSEDDSLISEAEGSTKKGDSTGIEASAKEVNKSAGVAPSVEPDEDAADLDAPPSHSIGLTSLETDAEDAGTSNESGSPKIEDEGLAAEKGESKAAAPADEANEVAEPKSVAEPLDAVSSSFADVKEKSFEPDPEVARAVREDASPEIEDEGLAAEKGEIETPAPVEQMIEVAEADPDVEPDEAKASLETVPSHSAEVDDKIVDVDEKSVDVDNKPVAVESKPADVTDRSGSIGDVAFPEEGLHAEDPAIAEESPKTLDEGSVEQGEGEVQDAPAEEAHEAAEAATNSQPDARVASPEATPSPSDHAGGTSTQPESEDAVAVGDDVSPQFGDGGSGKNGDSEVPEARVEEVEQVAEATAGAEPAEDASRLDSAISPSLDTRERGVELDSEDLRAADSVDVSQNLEGEVLADKGKSAAPEASVDEDREIPDVTTSAERDEVQASVNAEPSASVNAGERDVELDSEDARAVNEDISPTIEDYGSAEKGDSVGLETPLEDVHEDAAATSSLEADPDAASDLGVVRGESFAEVPVSEEASPNLLGEGSAEIVGLESPRALVEEVQKVAEAATPVEGNETENNMNAALPRSADVEEPSAEVDSEDARVVSEDVSPEIDDEGWVEKGESTAPESPIEVDREVAEATPIAQPDEGKASAPSPSVNVREAIVEEDSEDPGALNEVSSPLIETKGPAEKGDTEAAKAPVEEVQEVAGTTTTAEPDVDAANVEAAPAPVVKLDSEVAGAMTENVSPKTERVGLAEEGDCAPPEAPVTEINDVAEAITPVVPDEAVASLEAAPPQSVDVRERNVELNSDDAGTLNVDSSPQIGDGGSVEQGGDAAADAPVKEDSKVAEKTTSADPVEVVTISEAAPAVNAGGRSAELSNEHAGAVNEDVNPKCEDEESAEKDYSEAPDAPQEKVRESPEATVSAEREAVVASLDTDLSPSVDVGVNSVDVNSEGARALNEDISPTIEEVGSAEKDDFEAREAPLEEVHMAALASSSMEADPDSASVEAAPSPSVDQNYDDADAVREDVVPKVAGEGLAEKVDSAAPEVPAEEAHKVAGAAPSAESEEDGATADAPPSPSVDVEESSVRGLPEGEGDVIEDVNPIIKDGGLAEIIDSEAPAVPGEEVHDDAESVTGATPNKDVATLEAARSSSVDIGEEAVELDSEDARAVSADVSPATKDGRSTEGGDSPAPEAPLDVDQEVPVASTCAEPDEVRASLEAETLPSVVSGGEPLDVDSEDVGAVREDVSPQVEGAGSAGTGEGEAPEAHIEEVEKVADATTTSKPDEDAPSPETTNLPPAHLAETSVDSEDSGAVSDDISPIIKDEGWAEKGGSAATEVPADGKHEVAEAKSIDEPQVDSTGLEDAISPSVVVQERGIELDSENAETVGAVGSPVVEGEGWAEQDKSAAPEAPLEVNQDAATEALSSTEPDEVGASTEAEPSPSDNVGAKPLEEDSAGAEPSADVSLVVEEDGFATKNDLETAEATVEEIHPVAEDPSSCALDEDAASLKAATPPSFDVRVRDSELDSDHAGIVIDDDSPVDKDDGWAEKVDIAAPEVPGGMDQEVAKSLTNAEPDEVVASLEASPSASVRDSEKGIDLDSVDVGAVSADVILAAEGEGSTKEGDSAAPEAPVDVNQEVPVAPTSAERDEVVTNLDAESSPCVDDRVNSGEANSEDARALNEDIGPLIEEGESGAKGVSEEPEASVETVHDGPGATPSAEPEEEAASLNAAASPAVDMEETSFKVNSEDDEILNENVSPSIKDRVATEKYESAPPNAPHGEVQEAAEAAISPQLDEVAANPEPAPSCSVDVGETSVGGLPEDARALIEDDSPVTNDDESAEKGFSETLDLPIEEVHDVAEATTRAQPDKVVGSLEAGAPSSTEVQERSHRLDSEDVGAVNENASPEREAKGSDDESDSESPSAPLEVVEEVEDASTRTEPDQNLANLNALPSPSVDVGLKSMKLDSEGTRDLNEDVGPPIEEEVSAEKGDADTAEAPLEVVHGVAAATSSVEADPDAPGLEATSSPSVDIGDRSVELNSEGARAETEDASLRTEGDGSAKEGDSTGTEAPAKEGKESTGVAPSVEPEEEDAGLNALPSRSDGFASVEVDAKDAGILSESGSPKIEDEGSAIEKGESEDIAPPEEVNEVAEPKSIAEPLEAVSSPIANVEEKSLEPDREVSPAVSEDASPEIEDEGSAVKGGSEAAEAPVEEVHEVAEAATSAEPLEASPSPLVDVEEKPLELGSEVAPALSVDASPKIEDEGSVAEKGESKASAPPEEVNEVAEPTSVVEPLEGAPSHFANVEDKSFELDPEVAPAVSGDVSPETEVEGSAEKDDSAVPVEEVYEPKEAPTNAEPGADVATLEAAPSPVAGVGEEPLELGSEAARGVSEDFSPKTEDDVSAEKGDSTIPEEDVHEQTEVKTNAEPDDDVATLEAVPSRVADIKEKSLELDPAVGGADSVDVNPETEGEGSAKKGDSEASKAPAEVVREVAQAAVSAEPDEGVATLEAAPSPTVDVKEKPLELGSEVAPALSVDASPETEDEGSAVEKGDSEVSAPAEELNEVAEPTSIAEPLEAAPLANVEGKSSELDPEVAPAGSEDVSPKTEDGESAEKGDSAVPEEEVHELTEAAINAEPDKDVATLEAAPSPVAGVEEEPLELGSEVAPALSVDTSPKTEAEGSAAENGESKASAAPEKINEDTEPSSVAEPLETAPSPFANVEEKYFEQDPEVARPLREDASPKNEDARSAEEGSSDAPEVPVEEANEVADAAAHLEPEETAASHEAVPSSSTECGEQVVDVDDKSVDLADESVGIGDKSVEVSSGDVGVVSEELPAEAAASEQVSPTIADEESAGTGDSEAPKAPVDEVHEVAEAATSAEPDEDVATLEASPSSFVDAEEKLLELDSEVARALSVDASPETEAEGSAADKGDSTVPEEEVHELKEATTNAKPDEDVATLEAAPSPAVSVEEKPLERGSEVSRALSVDAGPEIEVEGLAADKDESEAPEAPVDEVNEVAEPITVTEPLEAAPLPFAHVEEKSLELDPEVAGAVSEDVSPKTEDERSAEKVGSAVPEDEVQEITESATNAELDEDVATLEAVPSRVADVEDKSFELDPEVAGAASEDVSPKIEGERSAKKGDNEAPQAPAEEAWEVAEAATSAEPDEDVSTLKAVPSPSVDVKEKLLELGSEVARDLSVNASPETEAEGSSAEKVYSAVPEEVVHELKEATTNAEPDADVATLEAAPSPAVSVPLELGSEDARALNVDASPDTEAEGLAAEKGESNTPEAPLEEVKEVAEPKPVAEPLEGAPSPFTNVGEKSFDLDREVAPAVSGDVRPETEDEGSGEKGDSAVPKEEVHELTEAATNAEPGEFIATPETAPSSVVDVGEKSIELDSENAVTAGEDASPEFEDIGSADKGESEAPVVPVEEGNEVAEAAAHVESEETAASHEDGPSSSTEFGEQAVAVDDKSIDLADKAVGFEDKNVDVRSGDRGAVSEELPVEVAASEEVSPTIPVEESVETGGSESAEAPVKEVHEVAEAATTAELDEDVATVEARPSPFVDAEEKPLELSSEVAPASSVDESPKIKDEGSAADKGESEEIAPLEEVNEVAEPITSAEPLEAAPSPCADFEEKSFELDPGVTQPLSEDVSPKIEDAGSSEEGSSDAPEVPVEEANEVADAAARVEPEETVASHEAVPSSSTEFGKQAVDVEDKSVDLADENVGIEDKSVEESSGDVGVVSEELPAEVVASEEVCPAIRDEGSAETGRSEVADAPVEEVHEVAEAATTAEPDEDLVTVEAAPSPFVDAEEKPLELSSEVARALSLDASPDSEAEGLATVKEESEASAPAEAVNEVAQPTSIAEPLEAATSPLVDVKEKSFELDPDVARPLSEAVSPETEDEGSAEKSDSAGPGEEVHELKEATTNAQPGKDVTRLEAAPSPVADVGEESVRLDSENAVASGEDVSPELEVGGSAEKGDSDAAEAPVEEASEVADAAAHVEPEETAASHEGGPFSSTEFGEQVVDVDDKSVDLADKAVGFEDKSVEVSSGDVGVVSHELPAELATSKGVSSTIPDEDSAETGGSETPEAPAEEVREVADAATSVAPDEDVATLEAAPSPFVDAEEKPLELDSEVARALSVNASPGTEEEGSTEKGESVTPDTPLEEVHEATEARNSAEADEEGAGVEAVLSPTADVEEKSDVVEDKLVDVEDKTAQIQDKSADVEERAIEMNSEDAGAVSEELPAEIAASEEVSFKTPDEESAETGDSGAPEAPAEEVREVAEAATSAKPDVDVATLEAASSPFVDAEQKPFELDSEIARSLSVDANPVTDAEGSAAEKGDNAVPEEEVDEIKEASTYAEPGEGVTTLEAAPSPAVSVEEKPLELGSEVARALSVDVSPEIEAGGSTVENGESEEIAPPPEINENKEPITFAEPLEAAPSPFADVEEKSFERDPEVGRPLSEDVSPKIADEGSGAEKGDNETPEASVEKVNEVAEAATDIEPGEAMTALETVPSPSAEVEEKVVDVDDESNDIDNKPAAVEPKPADVTDRSGGTEDIAFPTEDLHAEDPANTEESPKTLDQGSAEQGESEVHDTPAEEAHEAAEAATNSQPDARVASPEATPSPSDHAGGTSTQPESEDAVAVGDDVSPQFEDDESGKNGDSEAPEARVKEVEQVAEATAGAEPAEDASRLDSAVSPSLDARERGVELDSEDLRGPDSVDVSQNLEDEVLPDKGSAAPEASVEEDRELPDVTTSAKRDEVEGSLDAEPSASVNAGERDIQLNSEEAGAVSDAVRPVIKDEESARKGDSAMPEAPMEVDQDVAKSSTGAEPAEVGASLDAKPLPSIVMGVTSIEPDFEETRALDEHSSPLIEAGGSVEKSNQEATEAPLKQIHEVAEASSSAEPDIDGASLKAAISPSFSAIERGIELDSADAGVASEDASSQCKDGESAKKGDNEAAGAHGEEVQEISVATTSAESGDDAASEPATSHSVDTEDEGTADNGKSDTLVPSEGVREVSEAAIQVDPEGASTPEALPSPSAEVEEKHVQEEENSVGTESKPSDIDYKPRDVLLNNSVGIDDKIAEGNSGDVGVVRDELPAEVPTSEDVTPPFPSEGSTEKGYGGALPAPVEVANEVAEATTPIERDEAVASREAAAPYSVDIWESYFEQDSTEAGALNEDLGSQVKDGGLAKKGESVTAADAPLEKVHEVADVPTSAKADEYATSVEAAPSPSLDIREKSVSSEVADSVGENVSPVTKDEGTAEKVEPGDVADKSNEIAEVHSSILQAGPPHSVDDRGRSLELDSKDAGGLNEDVNRQIKSSVSAEKSENEGAAPDAPAEDVSEEITTSESEPDDAVANLKAVDVREKSSKVRSEDAKAGSKDASRRPRKFRWMWWGLGTVVMSVFAASLFAFFSGQTGGLAVPFQVLPFLP